jgi:RWD domain
MGRCNNRRTQQAAQELRNTPSRARFSKGPPNRNKGKGGRGRGGRDGNTSNGNAGRGGRGAAKVAVVDKLTKRVEQKQSNNASSAGPSLTKITRRRNPLANVDVSKLDELVLPEESLQEVLKILSDLKVKVVETLTKGPKDKEYSYNDDDNNTDPTGIDNDAETDMNDGDDDNDEVEDYVNGRSNGSRQQQGYGYSEYENDEDGEYCQFQGYTPNIAEDVDWEGGDDNDEQEQSELEKATRKAEKFRSDSVFIHLTSRLSFSEDTALLACAAIEDMVDSKPEDDEDGNKNSADFRLINQSERKRQGEKLALAMDWLCLHLAEDELSKGFKPNPNMNSPSILMGSGRTVPIPHPSISVAPKITNDRDWKKSILVQDKIMKFLPLGFHHAEAYDTFKDYSVEQLEQESNTKALDDPVSLRMLLGAVEKEVLEQDGNDNDGECQEHTQGDLDYAASERKEEEGALAAIYDDQFRIIPEPGAAKGKYQYRIGITPLEPLREPARSDDCHLHVFIRPGYPAFETPLLLFRNSTLPPSLLRRVNEELVRHVRQTLGNASIFDVVTFLSSELPSLQEDFIKEQRTKEMAAEQIRMRREAGHVIDDDDYDPYAKVGRRQRQKLKAAAKAFDLPEQQKQAEMERIEREKARTERVQAENKNIRQSMAERAIAKREKERQEEEIDAVYRAAISEALNNGDSVEDAREAASKAKLKYMREHGLLLEDTSGPKGSSFGDEEDKNGESDVSQENRNTETDVEERKENIPYSTPSTAAFMERLRDMYAAAAKAKAEGKDPKVLKTKGKKRQDQDLDAYHLNPPKVNNEEAREVLDEGLHFPRPVAVPVGELARVMEDVIATQKDQPWLVASEARAPETVEQGSEDVRKATQKCQDLSRKLKEENDRKYKSAFEWRKQHGTDTSRSGGQNGFSPQQFDKMLSQRERYVCLISLHSYQNCSHQHFLSLSVKPACVFDEG